jgi:hypothetical protein
MSKPLVVLLALATVAVGCKQEEKKGDAPEKKAPVTIAIHVDDVEVATVEASKLAAYPPLGSFLKPDQRNRDEWKSITVETAKGAREVAPADHPGLEAALYLARGGPAFGFFAPEDLAKKGKPQLEVLGVTGLRIALDGRGGMGGGDGEGGGAEDQGERPKPTADLTITVVGAGGAVKVTGDKLGAMPTSTAPVGDTSTPGWTLQQVLELGEADYQGKSVVVTGTEANLVLEPADLDPAKAVLFIKLNRQGQLRFRAFRKQAEAWEQFGELRGLTRVEVR